MSFHTETLLIMFFSLLYSKFPFVILQVSERPPMYLFDSPGIMAPRVEDMEVGMRLALCGKLILQV